MRKKLSKWKGKHLTYVGRVCLIKSVFTIVPLYYMSIFKAPMLVCKELTTLQRRFLWGWGSDKRKIAWVKWESICKPKTEGGLGIKDIRSNTVLLAKWMWKLKVDASGVWREVVLSKYSVSGISRRIPSSRAQS